MDKNSPRNVILVALCLIFVISGMLTILFPSSEMMAIFAGLAIATIGIVATTFLIVLYRKYIYNKSEINRSKLLQSLPEKRELVMAVSKTSEVTKAYGRSREIKTIHYISFLFPDGSRKNFVVDVNTSNTLMENDTGELIYKQNGNDLFFIDFLSHP